MVYDVLAILRALAKGLGPNLIWFLPYAWWSPRQELILLVVLAVFIVPGVCLFAVPAALWAKHELDDTFGSPAGLTGACVCGGIVALALLYTPVLLRT